MTLHSPVPPPAQMDRLATAAAALGFEIVDIAGFLDLVESHARDERLSLEELRESAGDVSEANADVRALIEEMTGTSNTVLGNVRDSVALVRAVGKNTRDVARWVQTVKERTQTVTDTLNAVKANNAQIAGIAMQVNTLAINAKIEAARAGDAGRGFAVVADAINDLSRKTRAAATQITDNIEMLAGWIGTLDKEADDVADLAESVLQQSTQTDTALGAMQSAVVAEHGQAMQIAEQSTRMTAAMSRLDPALARIDAGLHETSSGIEKTHARVAKLINTSETIVQDVAGLGGTTVDAPFIAHVQMLAKAISQRFDAALSAGEITMARLFDRTYTPIRGTDPAQVMTQATLFMDAVLPAFQEPALDFDPRVIFCAAIDVNGYLPTHNAKFSRPQGPDPVWNMAHCRNRRMFDDRVGLKAGRNTAPFLLQVYRRDMGGGTFRMMKDLSAPLRARGTHWGGLRLAYTY